MTSGQNPSAGKSRAILLVALVALLAVIAAIVTVLVSSATYSPGVRTLSPKTQVAAGSDHVDPAAGLVVRVPEGWSVESENLPFGTTALFPEPAEDAAGAEDSANTEESADAPDAEVRLGGIVLVGALTPDFYAAQEADNQRAAISLITGMGEVLLPIPGQQVDHRMEEISTPAGDGWALSYRVVADAQAGVGVPTDGLVYTAVIGEGDRRFWLTYAGSPADGGMDSPHGEWADEIVERLSYAEGAMVVERRPAGEPA